MIIQARERKDIRKQFLLTETNALKLKDLAKSHGVSENQVINCLIKWEHDALMNNGKDQIK